MFVARYIFDAGQEGRLWIGVEIASPIPVDLERFSRVLGFQLVPADTWTDEELASVGVERFEAIILDGRRP